MRQAFLLFALASPTLAQWTPELALKVKSIVAPVPSPDGKWVVWGESRAITEPDKSETRTQILLGAADGSARFALTSTTRHATSPSWSPDGKFVYFLSKHLYRISVDGGEPEQLTDLKGSLSSYSVAPDGRQVALLAIEERPDEEKAKKEKRDWTVVDEKPLNASLWLIAAEGDAPRKPRKLVGDERHITSAEWSPDSKSIAYSHVKSPLADHWPSSDIAEVDVASGTVRQLAATPAAEQAPAYSPDGKTLAYQRSATPPAWQRRDRLVLMNRATSAVRELPATFDEQPQLLGWAGNSSSLYFAETRRTKPAVYRMPVDGPPELILDGASQAALNTTGTHMAASRETPAEAPEAYVTPLGKPATVRVSAANTDLPRYPMGETRVVEWKSKDGRPIQGTLILPVGYQSGTKVPLLLNIHGGPAGTWMETFNGRPSPYVAAAFAAQGYAILRPNPRGSSGYGFEFRAANIADWGGKDYEDLMAGVDAMIAQGIADPGQLGVMGWSYGGFMSSWVITQTDRFKAAAIGAPVTDLWSFNGTADIPSFLPSYFNGEAWEQFEGYRKHSPITFAKNVKTPALMLHGEKDLRVPISQGQEFYRALRTFGVPVKMVTYPRQGHGVTEPKLLLDVMNRHLEWMNKYVRR
jgi:dipeptidyl aminopeptidase/acylaminoacyl peptidase